MAKKPQTSKKTESENQNPETEEAIDKETGEVLDDVPAGFQQSDTELDNYDSWDFDADPVLNGTVLKIKDATVTNRQGEERDTRLAIVEVGDDCFILWQSAILEKFFNDIGPGDMIQVRRGDKVPLKGGKTMWEFDAYFKKA